MTHAKKKSNKMINPLTPYHLRSIPYRFDYVTLVFKKSVTNITKVVFDLCLEHGFLLKHIKVDDNLVKRGQWDQKVLVGAKHLLLEEITSTNAQGKQIKWVKLSSFSNSEKFLDSPMWEVLMPLTQNFARVDLKLIREEEEEESYPTKVDDGFTFKQKQRFTLLKARAIPTNNCLASVPQTKTEALEEKSFTISVGLRKKGSRYVRFVENNRCGYLEIEFLTSAASVIWKFFKTRDSSLLDEKLASMIRETLKAIETTPFTKGYFDLLEVKKNKALEKYMGSPLQVIQLKDNSLHGLIILFLFSHMAKQNSLYSNIQETELTLEVSLITKAFFDNSRTSSKSRVENALKDLYDSNFTYMQKKGVNKIYFNFRLLTGLSITKRNGFATKFHIDVNRKAFTYIVGSRPMPNLQTLFSTTSPKCKKKQALVYFVLTYLASENDTKKPFKYFYSRLGKSEAYNQMRLFLQFFLIELKDLGWFDKSSFIVRSHFVEIQVWFNLKS